MDGVAVSITDSLNLKDDGVSDVVAECSRLTLALRMV